MEEKIFYILGTDEDDLDHQALFNELEKLGRKGERIHPHDVTTKFTESGTSFFVNGKEIYPAAVLGWVYEDLLIPGMYILEALERSGIPVINSANTLFCGQNKYLNSEALPRNHIPHVPVFCGYGFKDVESFSSDWSFPLVLKPIVGAGGKSVVKVDTMEELERLVEELAGSQEYYIQPYINKPSRDIRVTCVNYKAVHAIYRSSTNNWITNLGLGGKAEMIELTPELAEIAERASRSLNAMISGVDIVEDIDNECYRVIEVNTCPNFELKSLFEDPDTSAEEALAEFMIEYSGKNTSMHV